LLIFATNWKIFVTLIFIILVRDFLISLKSLQRRERFQLIE